jgi:ribosomal protein S18 acetylase RimI-like enzyme
MVKSIDYDIGPTNYSFTLRATSEERLPMAYASVQIEKEDDIRVGKLVGMIRHPEFKGMGVCRKLVLKRIKLCEAFDCDKVYVAVYKKRKGLIKLYQELGFKEIEAMSPLYRRFEKLL